jgi:hypothetical protein
MAVMFDTLKLAQRLQAAGMPQRQAQDMASALAETITGDLVTREHLDLRLAETEARLRTEIANLRSELIRWFIGTAAVIIGAVAALFHLMH